MGSEPTPRGIYARDAEVAGAVRKALEGAGLPVVAVTQVDLADEGVSLTPHAAFRVDVPPAEFDRAVELVEERLPQVLEWIEDLDPLHADSLSPFEQTRPPAPDPTEEVLARWTSGPAAWTEDLFGEDDDLRLQVLAWIESSSVPTAAQVGAALERACRGPRTDLIGSLCRVLEPVVDDPFARKKELASSLIGALAEASREKAPGAKEAIDSLVTLAWGKDEVAKKNFCLAAARLRSDRVVYPLVSLLEDPSESVRYEASGALYTLVHEDFGFDSKAPQERRTEGVRRWKGWFVERFGLNPWAE